MRVAIAWFTETNYAAIFVLRTRVAVIDRSLLAGDDHDAEPDLVPRSDHCAAVAGMATGSVKSSQRRVGGGAAWIIGFALALAVAAGVWSRSIALVTGTVGVAGVGRDLRRYLGGDHVRAGRLRRPDRRHNSRNYLDGDRGQAASGEVAVSDARGGAAADHLGQSVQFAGAIATSLGLNKLLLFYPGVRQRCSRLARNSSRINNDLPDRGDGAAPSGFRQSRLCGPLRGRGGDARRRRHSAAIHAVAVFLVIAALLKSAQFPLHGWLTEVMETPTPVSALLHNNVINAGGFPCCSLASSRSRRHRWKSWSSLASPRCSGRSSC